MYFYPVDRARASSSCRGFTLIEILVVVAILALLIAILLPSLARARDQARTVSCGNNIRQLSLASNMYTHDNDDQYPGSTHDTNADWLGRWNNDPPKTGRMPQDGVLFKYLSDKSEVYMCPAHKRPDWMIKQNWYFSYKMSALMTGAKPEWATNAHYPSKDYDSDDHRLNMVRFKGVPLFFENFMERPEGTFTQHISCWFIGGMTLANRHLRTGKLGVSNVANTDGSVEQLRAPGIPENYQQQIDMMSTVVDDLVASGSIDMNNIFQAESICVQAMSGKWVSMEAIDADESFYGLFMKTGSGGRIHQ